MGERLPLSDPRRIKARDDKLWVREKRKAAMYGFPRIHCPCTLHKGTGHCFKWDEVERHLYLHGRSPDCRFWHGPEDPDSSDEEWENHYTMQNKPSSSTPEVRDNGVQVREMLKHIFQEVEKIAETEEMLDETTMDALQASDNIINAGGEGNPQCGDDDKLRSENEANNSRPGQYGDSGNQDNTHSRTEVRIVHHNRPHTFLEYSTEIITACPCLCIEVPCLH